METLLIEEIPFQDPVSIFYPFKDEEYGFLLESAAISKDIGRFSFIGRDPFLVIKSKGNRIMLIEEGVELEKRGDVFEVIRETLNNFKIRDTEVSPFLGGGVGYLGYDLCHLIEKLPSHSLDDLGLPECILCFYDAVIVIDLILRRAFICSTGFPEKGRMRIKKAKRRLGELLKKISEQREDVPTETDPNPPTISSNFKKRDYLEAVRIAKQYIEKGDIYQVNLSQRLSASIRIPPFELYRRLRAINPSPFASLLSFGDVAIVSSSPERFLRLIGREVQTRPIKGTRPRGKNPDEDKRLIEELLGSEKDRAELLMIVDLLRNDLGRVCTYNSVKVEELVRIEAHPTVFHSVATITGTLRLDVDRIDLIKACFPGGSITGAPKIRAMEIIDELEPTKRGVYTGSIGYFSFSGGMDLNIVIRTFVIKDGVAYFQVGGGIVADSDPEEEYIETLHKGKALIDAVSSITVNRQEWMQRQASLLPFEVVEASVSGQRWST